jgi:hypothetical protein
MKVTRKDLNYLNMQEIRSLAFHFKLPINIHYQNQQNKILKKSDIESKRYLLDKIFAYIQGEREFEPMVYSQQVVSFQPFKNIYHEDDLVLYQDFKSTNKVLKSFLKKITDNKFYFGAQAFIEAHKLWRKNKKVTLKEFANLWIAAFEGYERPFEEWAYICEIQKGMSKDEWKIYRKDKSNKILLFLLK